MYHWILCVSNGAKCVYPRIIYDHLCYHKDGGTIAAYQRQQRHGGCMAKDKSELVKKQTISVYVTAAQKERIIQAAFTRENRVSEFLRNLGLAAWDEDQLPKRGRPRSKTAK